MYLKVNKKLKCVKWGEYMKWKKALFIFFVLSSISFANQEEINREERRRQ